MESSIYEHGEKGTAISDEMLRPVSAHESSMARDQGLEELAFYENVMKAIPNVLLGGLASNASEGRVSSSSFLLNSEATFGEEESSFKDWTVTDFCARDSLLMDLKLGVLTDSINPNILSSSVLSVPVKKIRSTSLNGQTPVCQVYGCCMDLTSSKDYYKSHKVCEVHSKTAKVIVDGTEQRFCQQCNRFHSLGEFDSAKRSCRKSLTGHNKRRRKSHLNHSKRTRRLLQSYDGCRFMGTILPGETSFFCSDIFPNWIFGEAKYENSESCQHANVCDEAMSGIDGQSVPAVFLSSHGAEQKFDFLPSINTVSRSFSSSDFDDEATIKGLSWISDSACALSLLSSQSHSLCTYSSGIPISRYLSIKDKHAYHASTSVASNGFSSSGLNSRVDYHMGYLSSINSLEFENEGFQGFEFINTRDPLFREDGPNVDLLQLSYLLQNAEQQRQSVQGKQKC